MRRPQIRAAVRWEATPFAPAARQAAKAARSQELGDPPKAKTPAWSRTTLPLRTPRRTVSMETPKRPASVAVKTP